jgi:MbtH protein
LQEKAKAMGDIWEECRVVVNHEEQHSIWPLRKQIPAGWRDTGFIGSLDECMAHVDEVWPDIRPASLRTSA